MGNESDILDKIRDVGIKKLNNFSIIDPKKSKKQEKCFTDSSGIETTDPNEFLSGGTINPISSCKGFGLAYIISIFCSLLSDGKFDINLPFMYKKLSEPGENSFFMAAIKIDNFINPEKFKTRIDWTINLLKEATLLSGFNDVYFPGEIEYNCEIERKKMEYQ